LYGTQIARKQRNKIEKDIAYGQMEIGQNPENQF
jgi:hypothetical protein